ncbi:MAG: hypothetical protein HYZ69_00790 [Candidatus Colwellbacteria bacterium]|nr:hypothetical protein [Candidatus Colwellbacteria bacterium]
MKKYIKKFNEGEHLIRMVELDLLQYIPKWFWFCTICFFVAGIGYVFYAYANSLIMQYIIVGTGFIALIWYLRFLLIHLYTYLLVTSTRLIYVRRKGFFTKQVEELHYNQFKTISCRLNGFFSSLFHIGTIVVDRGGLNPNIELRFIHHPQTVQDIVMKLQREFTYARIYGDMDGISSVMAPPLMMQRPHGYISAQELLLFLQGIMNMNMNEKGYMSASVSPERKHYNTPEIRHIALPLEKEKEKNHLREKKMEQEYRTYQ